MTKEAFTCIIGGARTVAIAGENLRISFTPTGFLIVGQNLQLSANTVGVETRSRFENIRQVDADGGFSTWNMLSLGFALAVVGWFLAKWIFGGTSTLSSTVVATEDIIKNQPAEPDLSEPDPETNAQAQELTTWAQALERLAQDLDQEIATFLLSAKVELFPELENQAPAVEARFVELNAKVAYKTFAIEEKEVWESLYGSLAESKT
ncbi:hypothetical protein HDU87_006625 [Geranomyces variabilis]|uniref:Uncharacterized protein n=1 Tax=Geranomyces variabilis TaxID=109894 RepID=A0AAD5TEW3_9FUNG|nr:hypothetical protein HDU87_006625 [Geranomyces variabilis]